MKETAASARPPSTAVASHESVFGPLHLRPGLSCRAGEDIRTPDAQASVPATILVAPPPLWQVVSPANTPFGLDRTMGPVLAEARQHSGGGREDTLVVGALGKSRYSRIAFSRGIPASPRTFYVDLVRRAAEAGHAVERSGQVTMLASKFGAVETASVTLAGPFRAELPGFPISRRGCGLWFSGLALRRGGSWSEKLELLYRRNDPGRRGWRTRRPVCPKRTGRGQVPGEARTAAIGTKTPKATPALSANAFR